MQKRQLPLRALAIAAMTLPVASLVTTAQTQINTRTAAIAPVAASNDGIQPNGTVSDPSSIIINNTDRSNIPPTSVSAEPVEYLTVDSLANLFSYYSPEQQPFVYDPSTGLLVTIKRGISTTNSELDKIYIRTSTDMGKTWSQPIGPLHNPAASGPGRYPSVQVIHPEGTTDPVNVYYYVTMPILKGEDFGSVYTGLFSASGTELYSEVNDGIAGAKWGTGQKTVIINNDQTIVTIADMGNNSLGVRRFSLEDGTIAYNAPQAFAAAQYTPPQTETSRTVGISSLDQDVNGTLYAGITASFLGRDAEGSLPAVSTSTDGGVTWSTLDILPTDLWNQYRSQFQMNRDSIVLAFQKDFVVTGPDQFSFFASLIGNDLTAAEGQQDVNEILEIYKEGGSWHIRKVSDWNGFVFGYLPIAPETRRTNQMWMELMVSRTVDRSKLLLKWVNALNYTSQQDLNGDGTTPDTLLTSDVFVSMRTIGSDSWSTPKNITETVLMDRVTWIPDILPNDLMNVPMLSLQSKLNANDVTPADALVNAQLDTEREQYVAISNYDLSTILSVGTSATTRDGFTIDRTYPNPANSRMTLSYSVPTTGTVSIKVYDALGTLVLAPVADQRTEAGSYSTTIDLGELPTGAYRVVLTQNGASASQPLTIVR